MTTPTSFVSTSFAGRTRSDPSGCPSPELRRLELPIPDSFRHQGGRGLATVSGRGFEVVGQGRLGSGGGFVGPPRSRALDSKSTSVRCASRVRGTERSHLNPVWEALRADDGALHHRLLSLRMEAGLPEEVSALRVFEVIA
ncbi:hypothetical protein SAMN04490220_2066 [Rhodococcus jostii]|uniref:Uncharacterized protein n=1 Tax=Rhodococcus jostii TaxID=132919 RepID=A0A1H4TUE9_RHOJO|nr:hypothetical protein SAMN04490220_2066 [Rhodococcus jostii]